MLGATSFLIALASLTLNVNGAATIAKRADNQLDAYEGLGNTPSALALTQDHAGGLLYDSGWLYVTTGGQTGGQAFVGIKPKSGMNVALKVRPSSGTFRSPKRCTQVTEFYYGCTVTGVQSTANVPAPCVLTIQTLDPVTDNVIQTQQVSYNPVISGTLAPISIFADMSQATITLNPAAKYRLTAVVTNKLNVVLSFLPAFLVPLVTGILGNTGQLAGGLLLDSVSYTSDLPCL
ncbi:hypothetical protein CC86DRAFT_456812 [Ophiobolus disseminans]|uniref:Uncharacterized protein n=1 Tax=Ophiobolus disseminans TaxID=1469910 RepID=A0A6A6ZWF6_9PLEO|nr:hypothetical protein CC86DRAFT_456812 [Ophiobolus disseminans]